jgi:tRNA(Ile)-lysidine synthase
MPVASADPSTAILGADGRPITAAEFAALIDRLGPFEQRPVMAVAVSGGADSTALLWLADAWARGRGGRVVALTVDHGLRAEAAAEGAQVGAWAAAQNIEHHVLKWTGPKPATGIQAAARAARYALLARWCRTAGLLHVLLGHHREDQAETVAMRLARGSGTDGLAGMAPVVETADLRWLRPLLGVPRARLAATAQALGRPWIDDPSNRNTAFSRVRLRGTLRQTDSDSLNATAVHAAHERAARDAATAALLARAAAIHPEGWAQLDLEVLRRAASFDVRRALSRLIQAIGGGAYPPRGERLDRLVAALFNDALAGGRTLGGCRIVPWRGGWLLVREEEQAVESVMLTAGAQTVRWDNRFRLELIAPVEGLRIARLGADGWAAIVRDVPRLRAVPVPALARLSLPAVWDLDGIVAVPHLLYGRSAAHPASVIVVSVSFEPGQHVAGSQFPVC